MIQPFIIQWTLYYLNIRQLAMKPVLIFLAAISVLLLFSTCRKDHSETPEMKQVYLTEKQQQLIAASNAFGFDFFKKVEEVSGSNTNMMVSPFSVSMALGMTRNGAAGATLEAMTNTLGYNGMSETEINEAYKEIIRTFNVLDPKVKLLIANSIWYRNDFSVEQPFILTNQQYFDASVTPLDFTSPTAVDMINAWVKEKTNQLIPGIIDEIPSNAVMYLINAVYFKGQWKYLFDEKKTIQKSFYLSDGSIIEVPAMTQQAHFQYLKGTGFEAIELPYNQGNYTMTVLLPDTNMKTVDIIRQLSKENWETWSRQFVESDIELQLPKFKYEYDEKNMKQILSGMGMSVAFDPFLADFTRINSEGELYISKVKHKTYIETNEEGSEAAAVTSVEISKNATGPDEPYLFTINRPFIYFIREKSSETILFIGTVMNPKL